MINVISPINQLGYGIAGLNISKELHKLTGVSLWPIGQPSVTNQLDADTVSEMIQNSKMPDFKAPCIRIWHQNDMSQFAGKGLRVGFPIFELDAFNDVEKHHLSVLDKIFVCSTWAKNVILKEISIKEEDVHVIPLGVDTEVFKPSSPSDNDMAVFLNCGKWEVRKGHDILVKAFNLAFSEDDNVELWMMCENPFYNELEHMEWVNLYNRSDLGSKVRFIRRVESQEEVYNIMSQADCGVFPSRAEGWNLELLEMMACGKQVIATDYSAHTDFCDENNSILIEGKHLESAYDGKWFHGQCGEWLAISENQIQHVADAMRTVFDLKAEGKLDTNNNGIETANKYSWENSAHLITEALSNV